ncbi:hypothetical protein HU200_039916 [Digitaria exilis]|uniref:F-box domain-containing protein n=1 Tax=Digitaria exilis TaxID=1010633 RepID=A0A835EKQ5_9POAL|nr:hypothetical protein HU200_039916 [Digitaria exilis]
MMKGRSLTDDLIVKILSRLPARSVCRFRCVSKTWQNLISSHHRKLHQTLTEWVESPDSNLGGKCRGLRLGFDPTVSPHFFVFEFFKDEHDRFGVQGREENEQGIAVVDTQGRARRSIPVPDNKEGGFIQQSQGRLHYANFEANDDDEVARLVVYVLEDDDSQ